MRNLLGLAVLIFALSATSSQATTVEKVTVNGFTVYLYDLQKGNEFGYVFAVPYGSGDDEGRFLGRAHAFEHLFSRGSKRYPGHETLIHAMAKFGFQRNAATGPDRTFYFGTGLEDSGLEAMTMHLGSVEEPELEASSIERELYGTVHNEVVKSAPGRPTRAVGALPFAVLPKAGHPLKGNTLGSAETLLNMTAPDFLELHRKIYHSGNIKLAVIANFTDGKWTRAQTIEALKKALPDQSQAKLPAYVPKPSAQIFPSTKAIEIHYTNNRFGAIMLPLAPDVDPRDVRALVAALTVKTRNGLEDTAHTKLGWASGIGVSDTRYGPHKFLSLSFKMTAEGYKHRLELAQWMIDAVLSARTKDFPEDVFKMYREMLVESGARAQTNVEGLIDELPDWLTESGSDDLLNLDWEAEAAHYQMAAARRAAKAVRLTGKTISFMGPDKLETPVRDTLYGVDYMVRDWKTPEVSAPAFDPSLAVVPTVELRAIATSGELLLNKKWDSATGWDFVHNYDADWPGRSVGLVFDFGPMDVERQLDLKLWIGSFGETIKPELSVLSSRGVPIQFGVSGTQLKISASGTGAGLEFVALEWLLARLKSYRPTATQFENARDARSLALLSTEEGFPGSVVHQILNEILNSRRGGPLLERQFIGEQKLDSISRRFKRFNLPYSNKTIAVSGAYRQSEIYQLMSAANALSPKASKAKPETGLQVRQSARYIEPWEKAGSAGLGVVRVLPGVPSSEVQEKAAIAIILTSMKEKIFLRARPLGYVQGLSAASSSIEDYQLVYFGQVGEEKEIGQLHSVWDEETSRWLNREISPDAIEGVRTSMLATLTTKSGNNTEALNKLLFRLESNGDPFYENRLVQAVRSVTIEEIFAAADKYFSPQAPRLDFIKGLGESKTCDELLAGREELRRSLGAK